DFEFTALRTNPSRFALLRRRFSVTRDNAGLVVDPDRTITTTPSTLEDMMNESATSIAGGLSINSKSYRFERVSRVSLNAADPNSSAGFGGIGPEVRMERLGTFGSSTMTSEGSSDEVRTLDKPCRLELRTCRCSDGLRRSASSASTRLPSMAK